MNGINLKQTRLSKICKPIPRMDYRTSQVQSRLEKYGPNELIEQGAKSPWLILMGSDERTDGHHAPGSGPGFAALRANSAMRIIILAIVVLNAVIGFSQEYRAEQAIAALKETFGAQCSGTAWTAIPLKSLPWNSFPVILCA